MPLWFYLQRIASLPILLPQCYAVPEWTIILRTLVITIMLDYVINNIGLCVVATRQPPTGSLDSGLGLS